MARKKVGEAGEGLLLGLQSATISVARQDILVWMQQQCPHKRASTSLQTRGGGEGGQTLRQRDEQGYHQLETKIDLVHCTENCCTGLQ